MANIQKRRNTARIPKIQQQRQHNNDHNRLHLGSASRPKAYFVELPFFVGRLACFPLLEHNRRWIIKALYTHRLDSE